MRLLALLICLLVGSQVHAQPSKPSDAPLLRPTTLIGITGSSTADCVAFMVIGGAVFALVGAGVGALIGLAIPHWERVYQRSLDGPLILSSNEVPEEAGLLLPSQPSIGQLSVLASSVLMLEGERAIGPGLRIEALMQLGRHVAVGPEVAFHYMFNAMERRRSNDQKALVSFGVLMRVAKSQGPVTPSLLLGLSGHSQGASMLPFVGGAVDWEGLWGMPLVLEMRWHQLVAPPWKEARQLTLGAGTRFSW